MYIEKGEGCLSLKEDVDGYSIRSARLIVEAIDVTTNKLIEIDAEGYLACCIQHEIDHLNGLVYYGSINNFHPLLKNDDCKKL